MSNKFTILYVDDEPVNLMLFENIFKDVFNVITAESGPEGIDKLHAVRDCKVVISDMKMPDMNGLEFIALAKNKFPSIAYFLITGYDITNDIATALDNGLISKYYRKPYDIDELENAMITAIKQNFDV